MRERESYAVYGSERTGMAHKRPYRLLLGVAVSLALHATLLLAYRELWRGQRGDPGAVDEPVRSIAVWLRPQTAEEPQFAAERPALAAPPMVREHPSSSDKRRRERAERSASARNAAVRIQQARGAEFPSSTREPAMSSELIAIPDRTPGQTENADVYAVAPGSGRSPGAATFDHGAALRTARAMADDPDPAREGTAVGQLPPKPYATETKLGRAIARAKRRDCKDGMPGGALGPLLILLDKKDSGCKW